MKKFIKSSALLVVAALISVNVFAADKTKPVKTDNSETQSVASFATLSQGRGVGIALSNTNKALVTIADAKGNVLSKNTLSGEKGYVLNQLEEGDYTISVKQNDEVVTKTVHVYADENYNKAVYFVM